MISLEKLKILTTLQKLPKNVGDLGKLMLPHALKSCPKSNKSPNLIILVVIYLPSGQHSFLLRQNPEFAIR